MKKGIWSLKGLSAFLLFIIISTQAAAKTPTHIEEKFPFLARVEKDGVNVRAGQNINFEKIGYLQKEERIVVVDRSYSWYKIQLLRNADSYISTNFVKILGEGIGEVTANRVNIRARKGVNSSVLGQLNKGTLVRVLSESEGWYKIEPANLSYGWVLAEYIAFQSKKIPPARTVYFSIKDTEDKKRLVIQGVKQRTLKKAVDKAKKIAKEKANRVSSMGIIEDLGKNAISEDIRHKLVVDGKTVYFLKGYRRIIDGFLHHKVTIEGKLQSDVKAKHPVLLVTKINLVL